ncbi:MAG: MGMT family protein [Candidatus Falkowbacteria bacterium]|nr:MAG: MGMT family protein [Candidatus Falkowbacteria bacterium]
MNNFSVRVYQIVKRIPAGQVLTYKQVAALAGSPNAFRAVGNILHNNRDPHIPCHRVIRSDGKTGGYNGLAGKKEKILKKEGYLR